MNNLKLLTLNSHSLIESNYEEKLNIFVSAIKKEMPYVIALQEVNQSVNKENVSTDSYFVPCADSVLIKSDNHAFNVARLLREQGANYYWTYLPIKKSYDKYDEGLSVFTSEKITDTKVILLSEKDDYTDWRTRKALGVKILNEWYYNVHFGWWENGEFMYQWNKFTSSINPSSVSWIMGDFNSPANLKKQGYDLVKQSGWYDTYILSEKKDDGNTATTDIDGWNGKKEKIRIDYIWCSKKTKISDSRVIFNNINQKIVSDHHGVIITLQR